MAIQDIYADIILPVPAEGIFTYRIPGSIRDNIVPGMRVIVPFGSRKFYTGIVRKVHHTPPDGFKIRDIESVLDPLPIVNSFQMEFWEWISDYYLCHTGRSDESSIALRIKT